MLMLMQAMMSYSLCDASCAGCESGSSLRHDTDILWENPERGQVYVTVAQ